MPHLTNKRAEPCKVTRSSQLQHAQACKVPFPRYSAGIIIHCFGARVLQVSIRAGPGEQQVCLCCTTDPQMSPCLVSRVVKQTRCQVILRYPATRCCSMINHPCPRCRRLSHPRRRCCQVSRSTTTFIKTQRLITTAVISASCRVPGRAAQHREGPPRRGRAVVWRTKQMHCTR